MRNAANEMTNYVETKICEIEDPDFQSMIAALCHCINLGADQFENRTLSFLLMAIGKEKKKLEKQYLPVDGILTSRVNRLSPDSVVYDVCRELARLNRMHIESFDGKTVLTLIKKCHKFFCPMPPRRKKRL